MTRQTTTITLPWGSFAALAARKKSLMVHPDKHPNAAAADHLLFHAAQLRWNEIVAVMQDEASRLLYDREIEVLDQVYAISDLPQLGGAGFVRCLIGKLAAKLSLQVGHPSIALRCSLCAG